MIFFLLILPTIHYSHFPTCWTDLPRVTRFWFLHSGTLVQATWGPPEVTLDLPDSIQLIYGFHSPHAAVSFIYIMPWNRRGTHIMPSRDERNWRSCSCTWRVTADFQPHHNYVTAFHLPNQLPIEYSQLCTTDMDNGLCGLLNECCWLTITFAVFGKRNPERPPGTLQNIQVAVLVRWQPTITVKTSPIWTYQFSITLTSDLSPRSDPINYWLTLSDAICAAVCIKSWNSQNFRNTTNSLLFMFIYGCHHFRHSHVT